MNNYLCVITGASSDIGCTWMKKLCESKDENKWIIIGQYCHNNPEFESLISCETEHFKLIPFLADLEKVEDRVKFIDFIKTIGVPTHILHLAAKPLEYMHVRDFDSNRVRSEMEVQFFAIAEIIKAFIRKMSKNRFGRIVALTSSVTFGVPPMYMSDYTAVKYAVLGFMRSVASEYLSKGICVNCISPDMIDTKFLAQLDPRILKMAETASPLSRHIKKEEVVAAIDYLFSENAACINGINLNLTGGQHM